jgi:protein pelota
MRILEFDEKRGSMRLVAESEDDLWVIHLILKKGDIVTATTTRDVSVGGESRRVPMTIVLRVERSEFQQYTNRLRIHGIVLDAPERYGVKGQHHTINLDLNWEIVIMKESWPKYALERIKRQGERAGRVMLVLADYDEYLIAVPMLQGIKILQEATMRPPNKEQSQLEENVNIVVEQIKAFLKNGGIEVIMVAGPGSFRELVAERLKGSGIRVYTEHVHSATRNGLNELLRRDVMKAVIRDYEIAEGMESFEKIVELMGRDSGLVAYGMKEVQESASLGAVKELLVIEDLLSVEEQGGRGNTEKILEDVEGKGGRIWIVPRDSPIYFQLKNLSGIAAILRYRIH